MRGAHILTIFLALSPGAYGGGGSARAPLRVLAAMSEQRASHTATLLQDGRVLIAGGFRRERRGDDEAYSSTAEIYDPATKTFSGTGEMTYKRGGHTATILISGRVLVAGGWSLMGALSSAELYDPASEKFTTIGSMTMRRGGFTATLLNDGRVLICGGTNRDVTASAELFDPVRMTFTPTGNMTVPRYSHTASFIPGGLVLITGGLSRREAVLASAEVYDPATGAFTAVGDMAAPRCKHAAMNLYRGETVILGGTDETSWRGNLALIERYDLAAGKFIRIPDMKHPRSRFGAAVAPLDDGSVLVAGGDAGIELLKSAGGDAEPAIVASFDRAYYYSTATTLRTGTVLILGGYDDEGVTTDKAWMFSK